MEMMAAFALYLEEGMVAVEKMYLQHVSFVRDHKDKSQTQVKKELMHRQAAYLPMAAAQSRYSLISVFSKPGFAQK